MFYDYIIEKNWASPYLARYTLTQTCRLPQATPAVTAAA